jgi:hypothetical protein
LIIANIPDSSANKAKNINKPQNSTLPANKKDETLKTDSLLKDSLSKWTYSDATVGKSVFIDDELNMSSIDNRHYFMLTTPNDNFRTENVTTKITVRNPLNQSTNIGYGILIHCDENTPGKKDYAFLIDSKDGRYRILKHKDTGETVITKWTKSSAIKLGSEYNEIEIRDSLGSMSLYINSQLIKTIQQTDGNDKGIVGLYTGTGFPVNFSKLEITK